MPAVSEPSGSFLPGIRLTASGVGIRTVSAVAGDRALSQLLPVWINPGRRSPERGRMRELLVVFRWRWPITQGTG